MNMLTGFRNSPDGGKGLARDFRVRWALEELGQPYRMNLVTFTDLKTDAYRMRQPFGQIPTWSDGQFNLFESGAIVLLLAQRYSGLLPVDEVARSRAVVWLFAALDTVEPPIWDWDLTRMLERDKPWYGERAPMLEARITRRLDELAKWLGASDWLEGSFSVGDLMMVSVLRRLHGTDFLQQYPSLAAYVERAEARPAFVRAFLSQKQS
ncbi:glutathione S-transferase family protein (plasmid) [Agrobacterium sp. MA01]|uniref:glutathione S-transferase family protein n=1 Tax=Agrobacterium sp. MA01 TaxID=2664893 RepID=UPI00129BD8BA|nr:glutathione S-transferase family protein [Agrobacterium sp. MA01]QGG93274.1 glutathione S-transferase family protein [Agrobacterium sp. MA01]